MEMKAHRRIFQFLVVTVFVNGCSMLGMSQKPMHEERSSVMALWKLYRHCVSPALADEKVADAGRLIEAVGILTEEARAISLLPGTLERMISTQPNRLAVDPRAMAAACSLSAGEAVQSQGDHAGATDIFRSILLSYQETKHAYYAAQARIQLGQMARQTQPASVAYQHAAGVTDRQLERLSFIR
jgi:hypothetical protein